jgi:hypothetical protein
MYIGGYDKSIVGWNLSAETDQPIFKLYGHNTVVIRVIGIATGERFIYIFLYICVYICVYLYIY